MAVKKKQPKKDRTTLHVEQARKKYAHLPYWDRVMKMIFMHGLDKTTGEPKPKVIGQPDRSVIAGRTAGEKAAKKFQKMLGIPTPKGHVRTGYAMDGPVFAKVRDCTPTKAERKAHMAAVERTRVKISKWEAEMKAAQKKSKPKAKGKR